MMVGAGPALFVPLSTNKLQNGSGPFGVAGARRR